MTVASDNYAVIQQMLAMPSRDESLWLHMTNHQRRAVLIMAGLPPQWIKRDWQSMTAPERLKIINQVSVASEWAQRLSAIA